MQGTTDRANDGTGAKTTIDGEATAAALASLLERYIEHLHECSAGQWSAQDDDTVRDAAAALTRAGRMPDFPPDILARLRRW
jgi:hypothetical protein